MVRVVYAITTGGSVLDILGVFERRELAESVVEGWRENMGVHDDGWGIQELTIWDREPTVTFVYSASALITTDGETSDIQLQKAPVYEWDVDPPVPSTGTYLNYNGDWYAYANNASSEAIAREQLKKALKSAREQKRAEERSRQDALDASHGVLSELVESLACPTCHQPAMRAQSMYPEKVTLVCAGQHVWETRRITTKF